MVFENPLPAFAESFVSNRLEGKLDDVKNGLVTDIHPLLFQYFAMRPAWDRDISSFAYARPSDHCAKHPLVDLVKPALLSNISHTVRDDGDYLVQMRIGPNNYAATRSFRVLNPSMIPAGPPYAKSTREQNRLQGTGFQLIVGGQPASDERPVDPAPVLDDNHAAAAAVNEFVSFEIERLERLARICLDAGASYVTDEPIDWSIVRSLATSDQAAKPIEEDKVPGFTFNLVTELSFLNSVSLEDLLNLREELGDEFLHFRGAILQMADSRTGADPALWRRDAERLVHREVEPAVAQLSLKVRRLAARHAGTSLGSLVAAAISGMVAWVSHSAPPLLASLPFLFKVLESEDKYNETSEDPMFFLLRLRETGE